MPTLSNIFRPVTQNTLFLLFGLSATNLTRLVELKPYLISKTEKFSYNIIRAMIDIRFQTMWYVQPAKAQINLRIEAVWSEPLLVTWIFYEC